MQLYGEKRSRREVEARVGQLGQIGGVRRMTLTEGKSAGVEIIEVRTGAGLAFEVTPSKGMDISLAQLWGVPLSWQSPNGDVHPGHYDADGTNWLRTASGGLLMTCGLSHAGSPSVDESGSYGLHGRAHHTPASLVSVREEWVDDERIWGVSGVVEETAMFGSKLRLKRELTGKLGDNRIVISDRVENVGFQPASHMMLYHFNFGYPLLGEHTEIVLPAADREVRGSGAPAMDGISDMTDVFARAARWETPDASIAETVYYHQLRNEAIDADGMAQATIANPSFPTGGALGPVSVTLRWSADTLPLLVQWRMPGAGEHVLGLEPANCRVEGRAAEQRYGGPFMLQPGESTTYKLELIVE
ncbi:aldose 1-epimerase family protein [Paenibacillus agaridevorans]|uniref:aldose 1-epimerase family protein n=1 Tax=Paenibacillus agaridevorans TaxID=171404 RepID=UPI001BE41E5D|nr:aldose 1-epimerase family protein [Paenibacillus agaridevorans]